MPFTIDRRCWVGPLRDRLTDNPGQPTSELVEAHCRDIGCSPMKSRNAFPLLEQAENADTLIVGDDHPAAHDDRRAKTDSFTEGISV